LSLTLIPPTQAFFSGSSGKYQSPPYEKLMINTMNMVNYLVRGDLNGARIEAIKAINEELEEL
jgi:hypothetical protein